MAASVLFENIHPGFYDFNNKNTQLPSDALIYRENPEVYRDICIVKALNKAKFPVYLVNSKINKQNYAMKVFPFAGTKQHAYFQNESRFAFLNHPNIIRTHHVEQERDTLSKGTLRKVSFNIMEYAPNGDFFDFVMNLNQLIDDKMVRTYFRQLIDGIEYLHAKGVSHMDLKLENLLLGKDFSLKIADFDLSYIDGDSTIISRGTKFYRPPELIQGRCFNTKASDIYSAGIILFTLMTRGMLPHAEDNRVGGVDFAGLLYTQNQEFWNKHCEIQQKDASFFTEDFKNLFNSMIRLNPNERASIQEIKQSKWYNGPVYTNEELKINVGRLFNH
jgi:serine/threonine protein kinase